MIYIILSTDTLPALVAKAHFVDDLKLKGILKNPF